MATVTCHDRASGYNHDCSASDNGDPIVRTIDSTVTTTGFLAEVVAITGGDEHLVPRDHTVFYTTSNVELPVLSHSVHVVHSTLRSATSDVKPLLPAVVGIHSPSTTVV